MDSFHLCYTRSTSVNKGAVVVLDESQERLGSECQEEIVSSGSCALDGPCHHHGKSILGNPTDKLYSTGSAQFCSSGGSGFQSLRTKP